MFGLPSLQKLIVLAVVVAVVWFGFKFLGRLQAQRKAEAKLRESQGGRPSRKAEAGRQERRNDEVEDLVACPKCGAYVRAGSVCNCGHKS